MNSTRTIRVSGPSPYTVTMGHGLTEQIAEAASFASQVAVIHQGAVAELAFGVIKILEDRGIDAFSIQIPDAEEGKTITVAETVWDTFGDRGLGRKDAVIAIGGGAATDFGGFVAATWMRGIAVIQVPTTLLGMVDAAVGGKTGINTAAGKNLVGSFHEPTAVFCDLDVLRTLPAAELIAGSAEIIKAGFIADTKILDLYEADPQACLDVDRDLPELVERAIAVKARVVSEDLKESNLREILNYGHTFGHAIEHSEHYRWRHGHAVAVGMVFVAELAKLTGHIDQQLVDRHRAILEAIGLPTTYAGGRFNELYDAMTRDKKNRNGAIRFVILEGPGETARLQAPELADLERAYELVVAGGKPATEESARS